ncbi:MAG: hypothetical protein R2761_20490 [Acidimicrobiales bacterium]
MARSGRTSAKLIAAVVVVPILMAVGTMVALALSLRGNEAADLSPAEAVNIRIHNGMDARIDRLFLGRDVAPGATEDPSSHTRFAAIGQGDSSDYLTVAPGAENYDNISFVMDGEDWSVDPLLLRPEVADLAAGRYYTIVLDQQDDQAVVAEVTADAAPT